MTGPERAAAPAVTGASGKAELPSVGEVERTSLHDAANCAACRDGVQPWTPARRAAAANYVARSGRRICDLPATGEVER